MGWIAIDRKLLDSLIWNDDEPFNKRAAWIDLLMMANYEDTEQCVGYELKKVPRGSYMTTIRELSNRWKWSKSKVANFLHFLESLEMVSVKTDTKRTLITIVNWELYQNLDEKVTNKRPTTEPTSDQQVTTKQEGYKNNKKNILLSFDKEFDALYKPYPKKKGKAPAKKKFIAWVTTGSTYAGQRYKFTIDEIFAAVNYYVETKEEWREWKDFSTLMNQIPDFVEGAKERDK